MKDRELLAGFAKTVLVHRHAFVPSTAATARIGQGARLPASFDAAYVSPEAEAVLAAAVKRLWTRRGARSRPGVLDAMIDRCSAPAGLRALEAAARGLKPEARLWLALALMRQVDLSAARRGLDELVRLRPEWVWPRLVRSELERVDIRYDSALRDLDAAERLEPGNAWVHAFRARVLFQSAPGPAAAAAMDRAVALAPRAGWIRAWRADSRRKLGDLKGAESDLAAALRLEPSYDRTYLWAGKVLRARGKAAEAERVLTRGLKTCPRFEKAMAERAGARMTLGRVDAALRDIEAASAINHRHNSLRNWTAEIEPLDDEKRARLGALAEHAEKSPRSARAWAWLGEALTQAGSASEGLTALAHAASLAPRYPRLSTWRGESLLRLGRLAEAERELDAAVAADPGDGRARAFRGRVRFLRGKPGGAVADLEKACSDSMVEYSWLYHWRAEAKASAGDLSGALADSETAVNLEPNRPEFRGLALIAELRLNHEGWLESASSRLRWPFSMEHDLWFHRRRHAPRLRALFALADKFAARDPLALAARGRLRRLLGDDGGASADLSAALDAKPALALARVWLAEVDLGGPSSEEGLTQALAEQNIPGEAYLYRAASRLLRGCAAGAELDARSARRARPKDPLAALLHGSALERLGRSDAALEAYAAAGRLEPCCSVGFMLRARLEKSPARRDAALEGALRADPCYALITLSWLKPGVTWNAHARRLLRFAFADPELAGWYQRQQEIHYAPYQFQEYEDSKRVLAARPRSPWAAALVARGILRCPPDTGRAIEGLRLAESAVRLAPGSGWMRSWRALGLLRAGRREEALAEFDACLRLQPYYHRALAWRGGLLRSLGRAEEALADLDRACAIDELYPFSAHERSLARRLAGDWVGAALELDRAYRLDFRYAWVFTTLREPARAEFDRAEAELTRAVAAHPSCASLRAWRGDTRRRAGDFSGALADLNEAAAQDPAHPLAQGFLGRALLDAGRAREALEPLRRATELAPDQKMLGGWRAEALFRSGQRAEAFALLGRLMKEVPAVQVWWVLHQRAEFLLESGRPRAALADLKAAERCEGRHADGYYLSARARLALGDARGADAEISKALIISPNMGRAYLLRAEARRLLGRGDAVLADYRVVLEKFPHLFNEEERGRVAALLSS